MQNSVQQSDGLNDMAYEFDILYAMHRAHGKSISQSLSFATDVVMADLREESQRLNLLVLNILKR